MEGVITSLSKIIYEYIKNDKRVDVYFYEKLWKTMYSSIYGKDLTKCVYIDEDSKDDPDFSKYVRVLDSIVGRAAYDRKEKELIIYEYNLSEDNKVISEKLFLTDKDENIFYNLLCLQTMLHEFEHIIQDYKINHYDDFDAQMLRYIGSDRDTMETYDYSLKERLAELESLKLIVLVMDRLQINSPDIYDYFYKRIIETQKQGYIVEDDCFISPTEKYLSLVGDNPEKASYVELDNFDLRIKYGLPVSHEDFKRYIKQEEKDIAKVYVLE